MSLGSFLLNRENLDTVRKRPWKLGRELILEMGRRYYDSHREDVEQIENNLSFMGLPYSGKKLDLVLEQIIAHYYEKLFVLVKGYEAFWIAKNRIEVGDSLEPFLEAAEQDKAVFIGQSHFGATYFMGMALMVRGINLHAVGNFPEPVGSLLRTNIGEIAKRFSVGTTSLLNLAESGVDVPLEMMRLLRNKKIVSNVYDENNQFCRRMNLLGREIMGGTGMDLILRNFSDEDVILVTPFLVRTSDETFRYELDRHTLGGGDIIQSFYKSLESRLKTHYEQWYFLAELHHSFPKS